MRTHVISLLIASGLLGCANSRPPSPPPEPQVANTIQSRANSATGVTSERSLPDDADDYGAIPDAVVKAFRTRYPHATRVDYDVDLENGRKEYKVEFINAGIKREIHYSPAGQILKSDLDD